MTHFGSHYCLNAEYCLLRSLHVAVGNHYRTTLSSPSQPPSTSIQPPRVLFANQQAVRRRRRQRTSPTARLAQEVHQLRVCFMSFITHVSHAIDMTPADHSSTRTDTATQSDVRTMDSNIPNEHVLASMPPPATIRLPCPAETHEQQLDQISPFTDDDFLQNVTVTCFEDTDKPPSNHLTGGPSTNPSTMRFAVRFRSADRTTLRVGTEHSPTPFAGHPAIAPPPQQLGESTNQDAYEPSPAKLGRFCEQPSTTRDDTPPSKP